jgi:RNA polymerase sigma-70 factor, ECF subfamily
LGGVNEAIDFGALRGLYPRVLSRTLGMTRSLPDAEDAVQDALARALEKWPVVGEPESPEAWLVTVAANAYRDRVRRGGREESHGDAIESLAQMSPWVRSAIVEREIVPGWKDELLGLLFACCHPLLREGESAALALATIIGLSTPEVARAFVVAPRSMEQRLARARTRLREAGELEFVGPKDSTERVGAVLRVLHLVFNEGYWSSDDEEPIRAELCRLAIGLARSLQSVFPDDPEVAGLLSLFMFHESRHAARTNSEGEPVALPDQERELWDRGAIERASVLLEEALSMGRPGPFQIDASISAVHCRARCAEETQWQEIAALYGMLEAFRPTPAVRVNRAFAVGRSEGPSAGLALLGEDADIAVRRDSYVHLVRATLLEELGDCDEALTELEQAQGKARNQHERKEIGERIQRLERSAQGTTK